ncbi:MCRS1 family protein [Megaselia abdita]
MELNLSVDPSLLTATIPQSKILQNLPPELQNDQKRRSSSRKLKRKRFDDEIVEYSISGPSAQQLSRGAPRIRTQSATVHAQLSPTIVEPPIVVPLVSPVPSPTIATPVLPVVPSAMEKRKSIKTSKKSKKSSRNASAIATKDLGRWKPIDDLALIIGIQQTNDLKTVHHGTKFSCKFTHQEIQARWYSLLYEESISRIAVAAMRNLHPELVENVQARALYSVAEEDLLGTIKSSENPTLETFQELLDKHSSIFYSARTAKALQNHWLSMKQYSLLPDQVVKPLYTSTEEQPLTFSDAEDCLVDGDLNEVRDDALEIELALSDRRKKIEIRHLENELSRWSVLVDSLTGVGITPEFDNQTLAVLRGRLVRYLMRSKEITFGRSTKDGTVDVDLSLEGPSLKVSRKQGTIKLRSNGDFFIANEGKRPIFIDGNPLLSGNKSRLSNNCVLEISGLRFVFLVNYDLINAIRHESAKTTSPLN